MTCFVVVGFLEFILRFFFLGDLKKLKGFEEMLGFYCQYILN